MLSKSMTIDWMDGYFTLPQKPRVNNRADIVHYQQQESHKVPSAHVQMISNYEWHEKRQSLVQKDLDKFED